MTLFRFRVQTCSAVRAYRVTFWRVLFPGVLFIPVYTEAPPASRLTPGRRLHSAGRPQTAARLRGATGGVSVLRIASDA
ncbi:hypothetical protein QND27_004120 [Salmonella enterica]|nr:hypothetical protein [Salmonella enterica]